MSWTDFTETRSWSKKQRIEWLRENDLNVPEYTSLSGTASAREWAMNHKTASIRCEPDHPGSIPDPLALSIVHKYAEKDSNGKLRLPPHFPFVKGKHDIAVILQALVVWNWIPIACDGISFEMNMMAGVIRSIPAKNPNVYDFLLEAALPTESEPASVRRVSHGGKINIRLKLPQAIADLGPVGALSEIYSQIKVFRKLPVYLEFSYVDRPVGWKRTQPLFWEGHILARGQV